MTLRPLAGKQVVVTRSAEQASGLASRLEALGATPIGIATIAIEPPTDGGAALAAAMTRLADYDWIVVTSPNGARCLVDALPPEHDLPPEHALPPEHDLPRVACVGPSTAEELVARGVPVDLVPDQFVGEGLVESFARLGDPTGRVLLVQAEVARPTVADGLAGLGWLVHRVVAYRTVDAPIVDSQRSQAGAADIILFTSSSTVERFVRLVGTSALPPVVACIGPVTAATARELGVVVDVEASPHTLDGLVEAVVAQVVAETGP